MNLADVSSGPRAARLGFLLSPLLLLLLLSPLLLLGCPSPEERCHDQSDLDACLSLCEVASSTCYRELASTSPTLAAEFLDRGCSARDAEACVDLAGLHEGPERMEHLDRGCALDSTKACHQLTDARLAAEPPDWSGAIGATVRACHLLGLQGCVEADRMEARYLYLEFCSAEPRLPEPSCTDLDPDGSYGPPDRDLYAGIDQRVRAACEAREPGACALGKRWADVGFARFKAPSPGEVAWYLERE